MAREKENHRKRESGWNRGILDRSVGASCMKRWLLASAVVASLCSAALCVRSWMRESSKGVYLMTFLWGGVFLLSLVSFFFRMRAKNGRPDQ